jgi:hypothetical protein
MQPVHQWVQPQGKCTACYQARMIENARLAWRDLYNLRSRERFRFNFQQLAAYGLIHFDSQAKCFACLEQAQQLRQPEAQ